MNTTSGGAFAPLRHITFAVIWAATVIGNTGSFMRDVASSWIVTDLGAGPAAVSLIQAAGTLPIFLLAIPAGVLSDVLDRRRLLIGVQLLLAGVSAGLLLLALTGMMSVPALIGLTFLGGIGAALMGPAWQAIVPEMVPAKDLRPAVALNSLGINIARSIGPAAGGLLLSAAGAAATYGADVASYAVVIAALLWWPRPAPSTDQALAENFGGAFRAGLRYARASRPLHIVLLRAAIFFAFASAVWALLPLVARNLLGGNAGFYGIMLGAVGAGAIGGALLLPRLRARLDADGVMLLAALVTAAAMAALATAPPSWLGLCLMLPLGAAWITALTTLKSTAQSILPNWVRGRALAVYLTVFNGAMAAGSLGWGLLAEFTGLQGTLLIAGIALAVVSFALRPVTLPLGEADLQPSNHWPEPLLADPVPHDRGPVLITIEYQVARENQQAFLTALYALAPARQRDGAYGWGITEDAAEPTRMLEWFMVESWAEHMRQHHRVSRADADVQAAVLRFHEGEAPPLVRHFLAARAPAHHHHRAA